MKKAQIVVGSVLGLLFVVFGLNFFLNFLPMPPFEENSPPAQYMGILYTTGVLAFVKVLEIIGGVLVAVPRTRVLGLLILTPIIVNILAFHVFVTGGAGLVGPPILVAALAGFLIWSHRAGIAALMKE